MKWLLESEDSGAGTCVEDAIHEESIEFLYEHPLHSYIINTSGDAWKPAFKESEIEEIIKASYDNGFSNSLPKEMLDKKETFIDIYNAFTNLQADRYSEPNLYWLKQSVLNFLDLFHERQQIPTMKTEKDLLDKVYTFIKTSRTLSLTTTKSTSGSRASCETKNATRGLGTRSSLKKQARGDHADLVFKSFSTEVACVEVGLQDCGPKGTKELQETFLKSPQMMRSFCNRIMKQFPKAKKKKKKNAYFPTCFVPGTKSSRKKRKIRA